QNSSINVSITDPDAESVNKIEIYYGVPGSSTNPALLTSNTGSITLSWSHTTAVGSQYYYYAKITQTDGDIIWTAPVWITRSDYVLASANLFFSAKQADKNSALLTWSSDNNNTEKYIIEKSYGGDNFKTIGEVNAIESFSLKSDYHFTDENLVKGIQYYRLKLVDKEGDISYSQIEAITINKSPVQIITVSPNPAHNYLSLYYSADESGNLTCKIYNEEGRLQMAIPASYIKGNNKLEANITALAKGVYFIVLEKPGERMAQTKFVKQ
ncbi:MAG: T9SS type A sorting domain-containing protein, partial [Sphingobacteriales bacterium]|nr:T9SS type A sorting domain-containing protein [Sphingobacteriales bacterium]